MMKRFCFWLFVTFGLSGVAMAQDYLYELGVGAGMSMAYGDVNKSKPFYNPSSAGDLLFRYNYNLRWSLTADLAGYGLRGDSRDFGNHYPDNTVYRFDSRYWQLGIRPEFNFWNYGWGNDFREKKRLVPFITAGIGVGFSSGTEDNVFAVSIPLGAGMKWKMAPRWNMQFTCLFTKVFSDGIDGIDDPMGITSGAMKNTDWIGSMMLSVTFDFGTRCVTCHNDRD